MWGAPAGASPQQLLPQGAGGRKGVVHMKGVLGDPPTQGWGSLGKKYLWGEPFNRKV